MVLLPPKQRTHPAWVGWYFCAQWFKKFLCQCLSYMVAPCRFSVMHMHLICKAFYLYKFNCASWTTPSHLMNYPKRLPLFPVHPFVSSAEPKCSDFLSFPNAQLKCLIPPPLSKFIGLHGFWGSGCTLQQEAMGWGRNPPNPKLLTWIPAADTLVKQWIWGKQHLNSYIFYCIVLRLFWKALAFLHIPRLGDTKLLAWKFLWWSSSAQDHKDMLYCAI